MNIRDTQHDAPARFIETRPRASETGSIRLHQTAITFIFPHLSSFYDCGFVPTHLPLEDSIGFRTLSCDQREGNLSELEAQARPLFRRHRKNEAPTCSNPAVAEPTVPIKPPLQLNPFYLSTSRTSRCCS